MLRSWWSCFVAMACLGGCAAVLGIEDAELDESVDGAGGSGGRGSGGTRTGGDSAMEDAAVDAQGGNGRGGNGGSGGGGNDDAGIDGGGRPLCEEYCDVIQENCKDFEQYTDRQVCLDICATLPEGDPGDTSGNTVHCRLENAKTAKRIEPEVHCPIAGPGGNGQCGENCDGYCSAMFGICPDQFSSNTACQAECSELPDAEPEGDATVGRQYTTAIQSGNSIQCRLYHVSAATITIDPHCRHAAGDDPCR